MGPPLDDVVEGLRVSQFDPASLGAWSLSSRWDAKPDWFHVISMTACLGHIIDSLRGLFERVDAVLIEPINWVLEARVLLVWREVLRLH